jgi:hypothetical protein
MTLEDFHLVVHLIKENEALSKDARSHTSWRTVTSIS